LFCYLMPFHLIGKTQQTRYNANSLPFYYQPVTCWSFVIFSSAFSFKGKVKISLFLRKALLFWCFNKWIIRCNYFVLFLIIKSGFFVHVICTTVNPDWVNHHFRWLFKDKSWGQRFTLTGNQTPASQYTVRCHNH